MPSHYDGTEEERRALDLLIKLARAGEAFFGRLHPIFAEAGLTPSQFGVLESLYHLGPLMPSQLAEKNLKSRNNLTLVIGNLERDGLVRREGCPHDRRAYSVHLTEAGRACVEEVLPLVVARTVLLASVLAPEEQEALGGLLRTLGRGAEAAGGEAGAGGAGCGGSDGEAGAGGG